MGGIWFRHQTSLFLVIRYSASPPFSMLCPRGRILFMEQNFFRISTPLKLKFAPDKKKRILDTPLSSGIDATVSATLYICDQDIGHNSKIGIRYSNNSSAREEQKV